MSILDMFRQQPAPAPAPAPNAVPANQGNIPAAPTIAVNPDGTPVVAALPAEPESPLAPFKSLWEDTPVDPNAPVAPKPFELPTADQIQKSVANVDFTKGITPEQLAQVTAGGEGANEALVALLNQVGQQSLAQSTMVSSQLNQKATEAAIAAQVAKMPSLLRNQSALDHMVTANAALDNPAIKPIVEATRLQLQTKYPNATNAELTTMLQDFIAATAASIAPAPEAPAMPAGETDWSGFLNNNIGG
jgi:hypothetical protein